MRFHIIAEKVENNEAIKFLAAAAKNRGVEINIVEAQKVDFFNLPKLDKGDLLLRIGVSSRAIRIERLVVRDDVAHFYRDAAYAISGRACSYFYNKQAGLPVIKTVPLLPTWESNIQEYIDYLGGFPMVMKVLGGANGVGVIQIDTIEGLKSMVDYVRHLKDLVLLRSFVPHDYYGRLIVVGDKVVGSHRTYSVENEFRTNALGNTGEKKEGIIFSEEVRRVAIQAVKSMGVEFGGVDILFSDNGEFYISEVNFPCAFYHTQNIAGVDVAGAMIDHLIKKSGTI